MDQNQQFPFSMDDVHAIMAQMRPNVSQEGYDAIAFLLGVLPNQGDAVPVEIGGKPVLIDQSIAPVMQDLVQAGVPTLACCSGVSSEHPAGLFAPNSGYLSLAYQEQAFVRLKDWLQGPLLSVSKGTCYFQPSIHIQLQTTDPGELRPLWRQVHAAVLQAFEAKN